MLRNFEMRIYRALFVLISVFAATVTASPLAFAQELDFSAADTNNDDKLSPEEVTSAVTNTMIDNLRGSSSFMKPTSIALTAA